MLPIPSTRAHRPAVLLVAGVSARLRFDGQDRGLLEPVARATARHMEYPFPADDRRGD